MKVTVNKDKNLTTIVVAGGVNSVTAKEFETRILENLDTKTIILDFNELSYISSAGLRVLLMAKKNVIEKDSHLIIRNVSKDVMDVFKMTGFDSILTIE